MSVRNDRAAAVEQAGKQPPLLAAYNAWEQDGMRIQRLKDKRGNRSKVSSEIECHCAFGAQDRRRRTRRPVEIGPDAACRGV